VSGEDERKQPPAPDKAGRQIALAFLGLLGIAFLATVAEYPLCRRMWAKERERHGRSRP